MSSTLTTGFTLPVYPRRNKMIRFAALRVLATIAMASSVASAQHDFDSEASVGCAWETAEFRFLDDPEQLRPVAGAAADCIYLADETATRLGGYHALLIEQPEVFSPPGIRVQRHPAGRPQTPRGRLRNPRHNRVPGNLRDHRQGWPGSAPRQVGAHQSPAEVQVVQESDVLHAGRGGGERRQEGR